MNGLWSSILNVWREQRIFIIEHYIVYIKNAQLLNKLQNFLGLNENIGGPQNNRKQRNYHVIYISSGSLNLFTNYVHNITYQILI